MKIRKVAIIALTVAAAGAIGLTTVGVASASADSQPAPGGSGKLVLIDAATDKQGALDALAFMNPAKDGDKATNVSFDPYASPTYNSSDWSVATDGDSPLPSVTGDAAGGNDVDATIKFTHEENSSYSLGGSLETEVGFNLAGVVDAGLSVKISAGHTWESAVKTGEELWVTAKPGKTVWVEQSTTTATISGQFQFNYQGNEYVIKNVSITQPSSKVAAGVPTVNYRVEEMSSTKAGAAANTVGGVKPITELPGLMHYIGQGH